VAVFGWKSNATDISLDDGFSCLATGHLDCMEGGQGWAQEIEESAMVEVD
jgi:hypothetical protein